MSVLEGAEQGPLPKGWRWARLGEVTQIIAGQSPPSDTYRSSPGGLPFFQGKAEFGRVHPVPRVWCIAPSKIAEPGDILISVRAPVGPTNIADVRCCIGRGLAAIRPDRSDRDYILYALKMNEKLLMDLGSGSTFQAISRSHLEALSIPLPPLAEQRRIASVLNAQMAAVERARAAAEREVEEARALGPAFLRAAFDGPEARKWPVVRLGDVAHVKGGIQKSPARSPTHHHRPFLTVRNVQHGWLDLNEIERFEITPGELETYRLERDDLLVVEGNGSLDHIGRNALYAGEIEDCIHQNHVIRVRLHRTLGDAQFVSSFLNSAHGRKLLVEKARTSSGLYTLSVSKISDLMVPLPSVTRQRSVVASLARESGVTRAVEKAARSRCGELSALPQVLLREAFAGRV